MSNNPNRKPGSTRPHWTVRGSLMDRCIETLVPLGDMPVDQFRRAVANFAESKDQAHGLIAELQKRGFVEKTVRLTPIALTRSRGREE